MNVACALVRFQCDSVRDLLSGLEQVNVKLLASIGLDSAKNHRTEMIITHYKPMSSGDMISGSEVFGGKKKGTVSVRS